MSHFAVLVIGEDVEEQLAPYDENIEVPRYKEYWDSDTIRQWERILADPSNRGNAPYEGLKLLSGEPPHSLPDLALVYNERYSSGDDKVHVDSGGIYVWSTYNPKSKWDWYQVGGRWRGYFKVKNTNGGERWHAAHTAALERGLSEPEAVEAADRFVAKERVALVGNPGTGGNEARFDADVLYKGDVDIDGMRDDAGEAAGKLWEAAQAVIGDMPKVQSWREVIADFTDDQGETDIAAARTFYNEQEAVKAMNEHDKRVGYSEAILALFGGGVEQFQVSAEEYVQAARDAALAPFAWLYEGEWHAPGKMGWFGASDDDESSRRHYQREFNETFEALPDETLLTLVDAHI